MPRPRAPDYIESNAPWHHEECCPICIADRYVMMIFTVSHARPEWPESWVSARWRVECEPTDWVPVAQGGSSHHLSDEPPWALVECPRCGEEIGI